MRTLTVVAVLLLIAYTVLAVYLVLRLSGRW